MVLWWIPARTLPTLEDAKVRLDLLQRLGPTQDAFTFKQPFPAPDGAAVKPVLEECSYASPSFLAGSAASCGRTP